MQKHSWLMMVALLALSACDNFTPREKVAKYDPETRELTLPYPCPDWSQSQTGNYKNEIHSNFGCAVNNNLAVQLENPEDLHHGRGNAHPDAEVTTGVIQKYRTDRLPVEMSPLQSTGTGE